MIRVRIIVKGKIQKVGYRAKVKEIAEKLNIKGKVDNLSDGAVEIIAEGEKEVLDRFIEAVKIKNQLISVQEVIPKFEDATGEFKEFTKVVRDEKRELHERADAAITYLKELITTVKTSSEGIRNEIKSGNKMLGEKIDSGNKMLGEKIDSGNKMLGEKIDCVGNKVAQVGKKVERVGRKVESMHKDVNQRFDWMAETYGEFGRTMKSIDKKIDSMGKSMKEMKELFAKFVDHIIKKPKSIL